MVFFNETIDSASKSGAFFRNNVDHLVRFSAERNDAVFLEFSGSFS